MIKKFFSIIMLYAFFSICLMASDMYFAPYVASSNINLNTPDWSEPAGNPSANHDRFPENRIVALASLYHLEWKYYSISDRVDVSDARDYGIRITVSSNNYHDGAFWFVSQSNPDSQRPFQLQFAGPIRVIHQDAPVGGHSDTSNNNYGYAGDENWTITGNGAYRDIVIPEDEVYSKFDWEHPLRTESYYFDIICDTGIVLPGEIRNGVLIYNNNTYIIAPATDYSAEVTIKIELITRDGVIVADSSDRPDDFSGPTSIEYTIPFSGFYDPLIIGESTAQGEMLPLEIGSSLSLQTLAGSGNIDLGNQSQTDIPIADINYAIYNLAVASGENTAIDEQVFIFLSSSPSPYVPGSKFRFVHEDVGVNEEPTPENSINYTIKAISKENPSSASVIFDGTDYLEADGKTHPGNKRLVTEHHEEFLASARDKNRHWHTFVGQLQLSLVPNPRLIVPGYYDSYVYVHVIVDDSLEVMQ